MTGFFDANAWQFDASRPAGRLAEGSKDGYVFVTGADSVYTEAGVERKCDGWLARFTGLDLVQPGPYRAGVTAGAEGNSAAFAQE